MNRLNQETTITQAGAWIRWLDGTGRQDPTRFLCPWDLEVTLTQAPLGLTLQHKASGTLVWCRQGEEASHLLPGPPRTDLLAPASPSAFWLGGVVQDRAHRFLPRSFGLQVETGRSHHITLYRAPGRLSRRDKGGVFGSVVFEDGRPASWSLLSLEVATDLEVLGPGGRLTYRTQSDGHGDFAFDLERLPIKPPDPLNTSYAATLRLWASPVASPEAPVDPDALAPMDVGTQYGNAPPILASTLSLELHPGRSARLPPTLTEHGRIVVKPRP